MTASPQPITTAHNAQAAKPGKPSLLAHLTSRRWAVPVALYCIAAATQLATVVAVRFPLTEGSAYYVAVARNLVAGRGLVVDAIWSYATPPLVLPRPAFELWQPLASALAAIPMAALGPSFVAAQLAFALVGAALAPLAWLVAREAARYLDLPARRGAWTAIGAGLLTAVSGPLLLAGAVPDSTLPFAVLGVGACLMMPAASSGDRRALLALGIVLGLAYLTRMEAIYLGLTFVGVTLAANAPVRQLLVRVAAVAAAAALVAVPWWLRNLDVFGTPFPTQIRDNLWLTSNEQIFAYLERPTFAAFAAQGPLSIAANIVAGLAYQLVDVLLVPGGPAILIGLAAVVVGSGTALRRRSSRPRAALRTPLGALLLFGSITFVVTAVLFPIATLWGTFQHAAGPLLVGLIVAAVIGGDLFVDRIGRWRSWQRNNAWLAPAALIALTLPITLVQVTGAAGQAADESRSVNQVASSLPAVREAAGVPSTAPVVTNRPIWLSDALTVPTLALPPEPASNVLELARAFGARTVVVFDVFPTPLLDGEPNSCFDPHNTDAGGDVHVFTIAEECMK